jgi:hypothetical protein
MPATMLERLEKQADNAGVGVAGWANLQLSVAIWLRADKSASRRPSFSEIDTHLNGSYNASLILCPASLIPKAEWRRGAHVIYLSTAIQAQA